MSLWKKISYPDYQKGKSPEIYQFFAQKPKDIFSRETKRWNVVYQGINKRRLDKMCWGQNVSILDFV